MPKARKPNPKSQRQISNEQIEPYVFPESGETLGNPNSPSSFDQFTANEQNGVGFNRSNQLSFKGDTTKPFSLGFEDIDEAIHYYFTQVIRPSVTQNGERLAVPVIYGSPERWKSTQKDGYYKDKNGAIMAPLIMFKRDSIDKNRSLGNKMDANTPNLYTSWKKVYNPKNSYSNFDALNNRIPVEQFIVNVIPDYVTITYSCAVQTYYVSQLNKIVEAINYASDTYWGEKDRFKFYATIDSFSTPIEIADNTNRIAKATFTLTIKGYVVPDTIQKQLTAIKKYNSKAQVIIGMEVVGGGSEFISSSKRKSAVSLPGPSGGGSAGGGINNGVLVYLNTNIQKLGTFVDATTATFPSGWAPAPPNLLPTSITNFTFFVNGTLVESAAISSFTQSNGISTLVIDSSQLGYGFDAADEIIAIGKFSS
jgi:hypothetical protein